MEKAILIPDIEKLDSVNEGYTRIYFGHEYCLHRIFKLEDVKKISDYCLQSNKDLTLVTPYMTDKCIDNMVKILDYIKINNINCEMLVNDFGFLDFINKYYDGIFDLVLGNLLNKVKKGRQLMNIISNLPDESVEILKPRRLI